MSTLGNLLCQVSEFLCFLLVKTGPGSHYLLLSGPVVCGWRFLIVLKFRLELNQHSSEMSSHSNARMCLPQPLFCLLSLTLVFAILLFRSSPAREKETLCSQRPWTLPKPIRMTHLGSKGLLIIGLLVKIILILTSLSC